MRLVVVESPYAAPTVEGVQENIAYARRCLRDCLLRGEAPLASHLLYTQPGVLDDNIPAERTQGIEAGLAWAAALGCCHVVYIDRGLSRGMRAAIARADSEGRPVEYRSLEGVNNLEAFMREERA